MAGRQQLRFLGFAVCAGFALSSCAGGSGPDLPLQCIAEVQPQGSYAYPAGVAAPVVRPGADGTEAGAAAINTCIRSKAAVAGISTAPQTNPHHMIVTSGGTKTRHYTTGTPPARSTAPQSRNTGNCRSGLDMRGGSGYYCNNGRKYVGG
ncbi:MAG: hypothetical protein WBH04_08405 [Albidovulum sp.]